MNREGQLWMKTLNRAPAGSNPYSITMIVISTKEQIYPRSGEDLVEHVHMCVLTYRDGRVDLDDRTEQSEYERWEELPTYERLA